MIIRSEQLARMDDAQQRQYHEELRKLLTEQFPQLTAGFDDAELIARIATATPRARAYGIRTNDGMLAYVGLSIAAGPTFHDDPKIRRFLELKNDDPDVKIRWMLNRVVESLQQIMKTSAAGRGPLRSKR